MSMESDPACHWEEQTAEFPSYLSLLPSFLALIMCTLPARKDRTAWVQAVLDEDLRVFLGQIHMRGGCFFPLEGTNLYTQSSPEVT